MNLYYKLINKFLKENSAFSLPAYESLPTGKSFNFGNKKKKRKKKTIKNKKVQTL